MKILFLSLLSLSFLELSQSTVVLVALLSLPHSATTANPPGVTVLRGQTQTEVHQQVRFGSPSPLRISTSSVQRKVCSQSRTRSAFCKQVWRTGSALEEMISTLQSLLDLAFSPLPRLNQRQRDDSEKKPQLHFRETGS